MESESTFQDLQDCGNGTLTAVFFDFDLYNNQTDRNIFVCIHNNVVPKVRLGLYSTYSTAKAGFAPPKIFWKGPEVSEYIYLGQVNF